MFVDSTLEDVIKNNKDPGIKENDLKVREKKCKSVLAQTINDEQLQYIMDKTTAKDMYDALISMFQRKSIASQLILRRRLLTMKFNGNDINDHFVQFDKLVRELKLAGAKLNEMDVVVNLLLTLPNNYDALVTSLEGMDESKLTLEYVKNRLLDEFAKRNSGPSQTKSETASAMNAKNLKITCFNCGKKGHFKSQCFVKKGKKNNAQQRKTQVPIVLKKKTKKIHRFCVLLLRMNSVRHSQATKMAAATATSHVTSATIIVSNITDTQNRHGHTH